MKPFLFGFSSHMDSVGSTVVLVTVLMYHNRQSEFWETNIVVLFGFKANIN